ncbi:polyphenol oxidase family protein [Prosthecobacter sp. SYSU 5D2]|uniref:polyphenol oxidase family protein n=1 Tax=Prosthecobacter sp. SYSU 5D2 TaxID=3134134 RepID=UPI0031FECAA5
MKKPLWMTFPLLEELTEFRHRFTLRHPAIPVDAERAEVVERLWGWHREQAAELGFAAEALCIAEQVHGAGVAVIDQVPEAPIAGVDGIVTATPGLVIGIYVADCGALYLADPVTGACGIVHSGKKGSELGIAAVAIRLMAERFDSDPKDIRAQLGPCIRPPAYEVDFASQIRESCLEAGVLDGHFADCGVCTSSDLQRFYSYRMEKGRTGRLLALLGRVSAGSPA